MAARREAAPGVVYGAWSGRGPYAARPLPSRLVYRGLRSHHLHARRLLAGVRPCASPCPRRWRFRFLRGARSWTVGVAAARSSCWVSVTRQYLRSALVRPPACAVRRAVPGGSLPHPRTWGSQYRAEVRRSLPSRYVAPRSFRRLVPLASAATGSLWCRRYEVQRGLGLGCQVTSCTQSRLLRAELLVKGSRHRLSIIVRVVNIGRELVELQHEKPSVSISFSASELKRACGC